MKGFVAAFRTRQTINGLGRTYVVLVVALSATIALYEANAIPSTLALATGLITSILGPVFSLAICLHIFNLRQLSRDWEIGAVALTYIVTCISFAALYVIVDDTHPASFGQPAGSPATLSFGAALYFSLVTITTTGYGDIVPLSGLARAAASGEIITGLSYQIFVFSLLSALISSNLPFAKD